MPKPRNMAPTMRPLISSRGDSEDQLAPRKMAKAMPITKARIARSTNGSDSAIRTAITSGVGERDFR